MSNSHSSLSFWERDITRAKEVRDGSEVGAVTIDEHIPVVIDRHFNAFATAEDCAEHVVWATRVNVLKVVSNFVPPTLSLIRPLESLKVLLHDLLLHSSCCLSRSMSDLSSRKPSTARCSASKSSECRHESTQSIGFYNKTPSHDTGHTGLARTGTNIGTPREPPKRLPRGRRGTSSVHSSKFGELKLNRTHSTAKIGLP